MTVFHTPNEKSKQSLDFMDFSFSYPPGLIDLKHPEFRNCVDQRILLCMFDVTLDM